MFLFSKEKKVSGLILSHVQLVEKCLNLTNQTVMLYFSGRFDEAKKLAFEVDKEETNADIVRTEIIDLLYGGAFLPNLRHDIHSLISDQDDVANAAETNCDFLLGERPQIPETMKEDLRLIYVKTLEQFQLFLEAISALLEKSGTDVDTIRERTRQVGNFETEIDDIEWRLTTVLFRSDLDLAHKIHIKTWIRLSSQLSDQIENLADTLNLLVLKVKI